MTHPPRLASLDAFRGFAVAAMVLVNNPGSWKYIYPPLDHAEWNGCTFTDLIFPFFLFAAGISMTILLGRQVRSGCDRFAMFRTLTRRAGTIFLIGLLLNLIPFNQFSTWRILGVLQRIALTIVIATPIVLWGRWRAAVTGIVGLFGVYLFAMLLVPVPGADGLVGAGRLVPGQDFGAWLDRLLLGRHLWAKAGSWDPEGLITTLPATASLLLGVVTGYHLAAPVHRLRKSLTLLSAGCLLLGLGTAMSIWFIPLNKNLWTPSFTLFTGGWALICLAALHAALDEAPPDLRTMARRICLPLTIYGMNPLFLFTLSGVLGRMLQLVHTPRGAVSVVLKERLFEAIATLPLAPQNASLLFAVIFNLVIFAVAWVMWRKQWIVKV